MRGKLENGFVQRRGAVKRTGELLYIRIWPLGTGSRVRQEVGLQCHLVVHDPRITCSSESARPDEDQGNKSQAFS